MYQVWGNMIPLLCCWKITQSFSRASKQNLATALILSPSAFRRYTSWSGLESPLKFVHSFEITLNKSFLYGICLLHLNRKCSSFSISPLWHFVQILWCLKTPFLSYLPVSILICTVTKKCGASCVLSLLFFVVLLKCYIIVTTCTILIYICLCTIKDSLYEIIDIFNNKLCNTLHIFFK